MYSDLVECPVINAHARSAIFFLSKKDRRTIRRVAWLDEFHHDQLCNLLCNRLLFKRAPTVWRRVGWLRFWLLRDSMTYV